MSRTIKKCVICSDEFLGYANRIKQKKTCSKECGYKLAIKNKPNLLDLTGMIFGKLTVLYKDGHMGTKIAWLCKCECGNQKRIKGASMTRKDKKRTRSCGCDIFKSGPKSDVWSGSRRISGAYWTRLIANASKRGHEFGITKEQMEDLFDFQNGLCALTGWEIIIGANASVDRIDSNLGYLIKNVQWVDKDINKMKSNINEDKFVKMCEAVCRNKLINCNE